jgi:hypothetical protein
MAVPADCKTVHVTNVTGNNFCSGDADYILDEDIGHWVNANNAGCRLAKMRDGDGLITGTAGTFFWAFTAMVPPNTAPPPGSSPVWLATFPCFNGAGGQTCWRTTMNGPTVTEYTTGNNVGLQLQKNGVMENSTDITWTSSPICSQNNLTLTTGTISLTDLAFNNYDIAFEVDYDLTTNDFKWYYSYNGAGRVWAADGWNANNLMIDIGNNMSYFAQLPDLFWTNTGGNGQGVPNGWNPIPDGLKITVVLSDIMNLNLGWVDLTDMAVCFEESWRLDWGSVVWTDATTDCPADADWSAVGANGGTATVEKGAGPVVQLPLAAQAPGGVAAQAAPLAEQAPGGVAADAAPLAEQAPGGVAADAAPLAEQAPGGVAADAAPPNAEQAPAGVGAAEEPPNAEQAPGGVGVLAAPVAAQAPGGVGAAVQAPIVGLPIAEQAPGNVNVVEVAPIAEQAPGNVNVVEVAPTADQAPGNVDANELAPTAEQAPGNVNASGEWRQWAGWTKPPRFKGWVVDELSNALTGPFAHENVTALTTVKNTSDMVCVTENGDVKTTNLADLREGNFEPVVNPWTDLISLPGSDYLVANADGAFSYRGRYVSTPFGESNVGSSLIQEPLFFKDAYLAIAETAWMHLGDEHSEKQVHRLDFSFRKHSFGHLWAYVESDDGKVSGQYKGELEEHMKVFTNVRGRRFRIRMFVATHHQHPWNLRDIAVGHLVGKSF